MRHAHGSRTTPSRALPIERLAVVSHPSGAHLDEVTCSFAVTLGLVLVQERVGLRATGVSAMGADTQSRPLRRPSNAAPATASRHHAANNRAANNRPMCDHSATRLTCSACLPHNWRAPASPLPPAPLVAAGREWTPLRAQGPLRARSRYSSRRLARGALSKCAEPQLPLASCSLCARAAWATAPESCEQVVGVGCPRAGVAAPAEPGARSPRPDFL